MFTSNQSIFSLLKVFLLLVVTLLSGCEKKEAFKVGFIAGTSGRVADLGLSGQDAVQLFFDSVNKDGGINGRRVDLILKDDKQLQEHARTAVRELIDEGADIIIGPMTSDMSTAVIPLLNEAEVVAVSPTTSSPTLSGLDDFFFTVSATAKVYAQKSARYHLQSGHTNNVVAAYDLNNRSYCENWLQFFRQEFHAGGGQVSDVIGFDTRQDKAMLDLAEKIIEKDPDIVLIIANSMDAALLCQQIRKMNSTVHITLADWGATERLLELGGKAVEGVTVIQTFDRESKAPLYLKFRNDYFTQYGHEPGFPGVYAHDAATVVLEALKRNNGEVNMKRSILDIRNFEGLQTSFSFDDFGDVARSSISLSIVQNGTFVVFE